MKKSGSDGSHWITSKFDVIHFFGAISNESRLNKAQIIEIEKEWIRWISPALFLLLGTSRIRKYQDHMIHLIQVIQILIIPSICGSFQKEAGM